MIDLAPVDRCTCKPIDPIWPDHPTTARQWNARCPECGTRSARYARMVGRDKPQGEAL